MTVNELRLDVGMSQSQFANHFGIPLRTYQKWEIGEAIPKDYIVRMMYDLLVYQGKLTRKGGEP